MLATARRALAGIDGATLLSLAQLSEQDGLTLLAAVAGTPEALDRDGAARIVALCGGLPLALRIAGARLASHGDVDAVRLGGILADERARLDELAVGDRDVRGTLALSYSKLEPITARLFGLLGALPVPETSPWVAACLLDTTGTVAEHALRELADAALLTATIGSCGPRYRLHDLVQLYAQEQAENAGTAAAIEQALRRVYEAAAGLTVAYDTQLNSAAYPTPLADPQWYRPLARPAPASPTDWYATERNLLFGAVTDALQQGWADLAGRLLTSMTNLVGMRNRPDNWCRLAERVLPAIRGVASDGCPDEAALLLALGGMLRLRNEGARVTGATPGPVAVLPARRFRPGRDVRHPAWCCAPWTRASTGRGGRIPVGDRPVPVGRQPSAGGAGTPRHRQRLPGYRPTG